MKKPKLKKRGTIWLVYREKHKAFQCSTLAAAIFYYKLLVLESKNIF